MHSRRRTTVSHISRLESGESDSKTGQASSLPDNKDPFRPAASHTSSQKSFSKPNNQATYPKKSKPRFAHLITRTKSVRLEENSDRSSTSSGRRSKPSTLISSPSNYQFQIRYELPDEPAPMTAPLPAERVLREEGNPGHRNRSADRGKGSASTLSDSRHPNSNLNPNTMSGGGFKDGAGSHLFNNIRNTSSRAAGGLNKAGNRIMAKMNRSGSSSNQNEEERYVCKFINLSLVEQTRRTRLADRLENSKDRTEFWMPALPWRCIE